MYPKASNKQFYYLISNSLYSHLHCCYHLHPVDALGVSSINITGRKPAKDRPATSHSYPIRSLPQGRDNLVSETMSSGSENDNVQALIAAQEERFQARFMDINNSFGEIKTLLSSLMDRMTVLEKGKNLEDAPITGDFALSAANRTPPPASFPVLGGAEILQPDGNMRPPQSFMTGPSLGGNQQVHDTSVKDFKADASSIGTGAVPRFFKLEFPRYDGKTDPLPWLTRCEQFFRGQKTEEQHKVWLASYHMDDNAHHWYFHLERSHGEPPWHEFKTLCNTRFGPPIRSNPLGELRHLRQNGTVEDYQSRFLALLSH
ncbi:uncharacterized protein LOC133887211 [Phragmites australis]|uniref:uncharacterized protein LOC133887211 n=1 Tax=Phragmites australis TaxID=29695 RepID=UPI002D788A54|nr:uncharacterized protein LOC133887211 [Phragmites australis]